MSPSQDPNECILSVSDVSIDSRQNPQVLTVFLPRSKTDQFGTGNYIYLGRTGTPLCPVAAVLAYLSICPSTPGPLFIFHDGIPLSRTQLISHLRDALLQVGANFINFSGHSFRIGAGPTAAVAGFSNSLIQKLDRWQSTASQRTSGPPLTNWQQPQGRYQELIVVYTKHITIGLVTPNRVPGSDSLSNNVVLPLPHTLNNTH